MKLSAEHLQGNIHQWNNTQPDPMCQALHNCSSVSYKGSTNHMTTIATHSNTTIATKSKDIFVKAKVGKQVDICT